MKGMLPLQQYLSPLPSLLLANSADPLQRLNNPDNPTCPPFQAALLQPHSLNLIPQSLLIKESGG
eukprot:c36012_g1_i1 orf=58-252(+)